MTYINKETAGKERDQLIRNILVAIRELNQSQQFDDNAKDIVAFIGLELLSIYKSIDASVLAWEKRNYWAKADKYRMEWLWTQGVARNLRTALNKEDMPTIMAQLAKVMDKFGDKTLPKSAKTSRDWLGSASVIRSTKELV